jgi:hypothetical protein
VAHAKCDFSTTTASIEAAPTGIDASCHGAPVCERACPAEHFIFARFVCFVFCVFCILCVLYFVCFVWVRAGHTVCYDGPKPRGLTEAGSVWSWELRASSFERWRYLPHEHDPLRLSVSCTHPTLCQSSGRCVIASWCDCVGCRGSSTAAKVCPRRHVGEFCGSVCVCGVL